MISHCDKISNIEESAHIQSQTVGYERFITTRDIFRNRAVRMVRQIWLHCCTGRNGSSGIKLITCSSISSRKLPTFSHKSTIPKNVIDLPVVIPKYHLFCELNCRQSVRQARRRVMEQTQIRPPPILGKVNGPGLNHSRYKKQDVYFSEWCNWYWCNIHHVAGALSLIFLCRGISASAGIIIHVFPGGRWIIHLNIWRP